VLSLFVANQYLASARGIKQINANSRAPKYDQFSTALTGLMSIRAFDKTEFYKERMFRIIDNGAKSEWALALCAEWLNFRTQMLGVLFTVLLTTAVAFSRFDPSFAGFILSFSLKYTEALGAVLRQIADLRIGFSSVEQVVEYTNLESERQDGIIPPASWPSEGRIEVKNLVVTYHKSLPPVLKDISFSTDKHERIGIVGRTGAGKSTLALAMFQFMEATAGTIVIDGLDTSTIKLPELRRRMILIPQDPILFSGTLRSNLDVLGKLEDAELMKILETVHLISPKTDTLENEKGRSGLPIPSPDKNIFEDLSTQISEGGLNISQGQRQLVCMARAIVERQKIMIMDEATSAVDMPTDRLIQQSIRTNFPNSTLLVIAHRLSTVADFDRILVFQEGRIAEFASPLELYNAKGIFYDMVSKSGESDTIHKIIMDGALKRS
jgi:ABC-type multidrug transport system fused ATPase/permease subunit